MSTLERRLTRFPGSSNAITAKKRTANKDHSNDPQRLSASRLPKTPKFSERYTRPRLGLPINPEATPWKSRRGQSNPYPKVPTVNDRFLNKSSPWDQYYAIFEDFRTYNIIAHSKKEAHDIVAIKEKKRPSGDAFTGLKRCIHPNIVALYYVYFDKESLFFIYEHVNITIAEIQSSPVGGFASYEIAAVCYEILQAIKYIHDDLRLVHGFINADTVVITRDGNIKLSHIGAAMLEGISSDTQTQDDYKALGLLMVRLMEPGTSHTNPDTLELREPQKWDSAIKSFLRETALSAGDKLRAHEFLLKSPSTHFFKALVLVTELSVSKDWRLLMHD